MTPWDTAFPVVVLSSFSGLAPTNKCAVDFPPREPFPGWSFRSPADSDMDPLKVGTPGLYPPTPLRLVAGISSSDMSSCFFMVSRPGVIPESLFMFIASVSVTHFYPLSDTLLDYIVVSIVSFIFRDSGSCAYLKSGVALYFLPSGKLLDVRSESVFSYLSLELSHFFGESPHPADSSAIFAPDFTVCSQDSSTVGHVGFSACSNFPTGHLQDSKFYMTVPTKRMSELRALVVARPVIADKTITGPGSSTPERTTVTASQPLVDLPSISVLALFLEPFVEEI